MCSFVVIYAFLKVYKASIALVFYMDWNTIIPIPSKKELMDRAVQKAKKIQEPQPHQNIKRISSMTNYIVDTLDKTMKSFPTFEELSPFYRALVSVRLQETMRQQLARIGGMKKTLRSVARQMSARKEPFSHFVARADSILKEEALYELSKGRMVLRSFPIIKEHLFTVCIGGFPNVGKTTLLNRLAQSSAQVNSYAFTTKKLNVAYLTQDYSVQLIDTPGTLNRDKMNRVEHQAYLALEHVADLIVYVYDLSEPYPLAMQEELDEQMKRFAPVLYYCSKRDLLGDAPIGAYAKQSKKKIYTFEELRTELLVGAKRRRSIL